MLVDTPPACRRDSLVEARLLDNGFDSAAASAWAAYPVPWSQERTITEALLWRALGMDGADAADWCADGWPAESAAPWHRRGYTLQQANFVERAYHRARRAMATNGASTSPLDAPHAWRDSDIPPDVVILALAVGHRSVDGGRQFEAELVAEPSLRGTLAIRLAMQGLDVIALCRSRLV